MLISAGGVAVSYPSETKFETICRWISGIFMVLTLIFLLLVLLLGDHTGNEGGEYGILFGLPAFFLFYPLAVFTALILTAVGFFKALKNK